MNKNIEHYVLHKKNLLDEKYCDNCIKELSVCEWEKAQWYFPTSDSKKTLAGKYEPDVCTNSDSKNLEEINDFIIKNLHSVISEYMESLKLPWYWGWTAYSELKFMRYSQDQLMLEHWDNTHGLFDGERKGVPFLSIIGALNDDYEGGELIMFEDKKIDIKKGDVLIFPSTFLYLHKITPIIEGVRYSYQSWVW